MPRTTSTTTTVHPSCPDLANPLGDLGKPDFLEQYVVGPFRLWHMIFLCSGGLLTLIILVCCIFRVRIPRTKQEIETDFKRKKLTRKFRWHLNKMNIEDTNLKAALDLVRERVDEDPQIENGEVPEGGESLEEGEEGKAGSDATPASVRSGTQTTVAAVTPNSIARSAALIAQSSTEDEVTKASDTASSRTTKKKEKKAKTKKSSKNQEEEKEEEIPPKEEAKKESKEKTGKKKKKDKQDKADTSANS